MSTSILDFKLAKLGLYKVQKNFNKNLEGLFYYTIETMISFFFIIYEHLAYYEDLKQNLPRSDNDDSLEQVQSRLLLKNENIFSAIFALSIYYFCENLEVWTLKWNIAKHLSSKIESFKGYFCCFRRFLWRLFKDMIVVQLLHMSASNCMIFQPGQLERVTWR